MLERVELVLSNESNRFPFDAAEVTIGRSVTSDGESQYTLNSDPIRLIDLQHMIARAGIGAKSYTVISQGMVDRYINATPLGRKELFDEATGIKSLQIKVSQAERNLLSSQQNAQQISLILNELTPRLRVLERQVAKEEERQEIEKRTKELESAWLYQQWHTLQEKLAAQQALISTLGQKASHTRESNRQLELTFIESFQKTATDQAALAQELKAAQDAYDTHSSAHHLAIKKKEELLKNLEQTRHELELAENTLTKLQQENVTFDWLASVRQLLNECLLFIENTTEKGLVDQNKANTLKQNLRTKLDRLDNNHPIESAKALLKQLEAPLQEVARLKAIKYERRTTLSQLTVPPVPTKEKIEDLQAKISSFNTLQNVSSETIKAQLEQSREEDRTAQQDLHQAQLIFQHAQEQIRSHEEIILRERGTIFLQNIQKGSANEHQTTKVSKKDLVEARGQLANLGAPDPLAQKEYSEVLTRHEHLSQQYRDIQKTITNILQVIEQLRIQMDETFSTQFQLINKSFQEHMNSFFPGAIASLTTQNGGIDIQATLANKRLSSLQSLSGGERTLVALALLLAVIDAQKPPFLVLDEVDAALDEANARRFALALKEKSEHIQCIMITHNRETMSQADILFGVTMDQHVSSNVYSVRLQDIPS